VLMGVKTLLNSGRFSDKLAVLQSFWASAHEFWLITFT
jgi:hypothetical protein